VAPGLPAAAWSELVARLQPALCLRDRTADGFKGDLVAVRPGPSAAASFADADVERRSADPVLALVTSGSTGYPKVCVHRRAAFGGFHEHVTQAAWGIASSDRVLAASGPHFSFGLQGLHVPLSVGATAVLRPASPRHVGFLEVAEAERVTVTLAVPTFYHLLARKAERPYDLKTLRLSLAAGEHLPPAVRERWREFSGGATILNSIGTTETFLPYLTERVADEAGALRRIGAFSYRLVPAESFVVASVASPFSMLGYLTGPLDSFCPSESPWIDTHDVFAERRDAGFDFVGRRSEYTKVAGCWVAPSMLEDFLFVQAGVTGASAVVVRGPEGLQRLRAFVTLAPGAAQDPAGWLSSITARMEGLRPRALRPDEVRIVSELPVSPSGKVLKRALEGAPFEAGALVGGP
jgi:acyl-coenzyme A synthetase/AMP-(fatty) acid ligase